MTTLTRPPQLDDYLGKVRTHLPLRQAKDILLELESNILDRVEHMASEEGRDPDDDHFERVFSEMGAPEAVAAGYHIDRYLVGPAEFRPFLFYTGLAFALHMVLVGVATALGETLSFGLFSVTPMGHEGMLSMLSSAARALVVDVGLVVFVFAALGTARRSFSPVSPSLLVDCSRRRAWGGVVLSVVVAVFLNFFRNDVIVVWIGEDRHPLFTEAFSGVLPVITAVLLLAAGKDLFYAFGAERRSTLIADAVHGMLGVAAMLYLLRADALLALPPLESFQAFLEPVNQFLAQLARLVVVCTALLFATKTVRRLIRIAHV